MQHFFTFPEIHTSKQSAHVNTTSILYSFYIFLKWLSNIVLLPMLTILFIEIYTAGIPSLLQNEIHEGIIICTGIFFAEWLVGLLLAIDKKRYLFNFWLLCDLLSSIPFVGFFQVSRISRLSHLIRLLRFSKLLRLYRFNLPYKEIVLALASLLSLALSSTLAIQTVEPSNFVTIEDGLWWSLVTISTVGYGDLYPSTSLGRIIACILIFVGIGFFSYITGAISARMYDPEEEEILKMLTKIDGRLDELENLIHKDPTAS